MTFVTEPDKQTTDLIIFGPDDVDLSRSPLRSWIHEETYVLGAFNPALTRLANGNLLLMVRVAEALRNPIRDGFIHSIRWEKPGRYVLDAWPLDQVDTTDPRVFGLLNQPSRVIGVTSLSWLLPVELSADGTRIIKVHYDAIVAPSRTCQEYGVEDARISIIGHRWCMTTCSVSSERHSTTLYFSKDGLHYVLDGPVLDHQNKDMLLFEGLVKGKYYALTRPMGDVYFTTPPGSPWQSGPSINLAVSPDGMHWRPVDVGFIRPRKNSLTSSKIGGGTPPILTDSGWLLLYHGVEPGGLVGTYRTFWALLDATNPAKVLHVEDQVPLLESAPELTVFLGEKLYLSNIVFTTGIADGGEFYVVASGENDIACRITHFPKDIFKWSAPV